MILLDGKYYKLEEAWVIPKVEVDIDYPQDYGEVLRYHLDVARSEVKLKKAFVLVEVAKDE